MPLAAAHALGRFAPRWLPVTTISPTLLGLQLVAHVSANKVILRRWEEGNVREWSAISYPNQVGWERWGAICHLSQRNPGRLMEGALGTPAPEHSCS